MAAMPYVGADGQPLKLAGRLPLPRCPHCGVNKPLLDLLNGPHKTEGEYGGAHVLFKCSACGGVVLCTARGGNNEVVAMYPRPRVPPADLPDQVKQLLSEAGDTLHAPGLSIIGSSRAVQSMLHARNIKTGTLYARIDQAAAEHLVTEDMKAWAHEVRLDANTERHLEEGATPPTPADARRCLEFATALAEILFTLPERVKRGREKR